MENIDLSELFSSELKSGFNKSKKFIYMSIPLGIVFGILLGIGNFQSAQNNYYSETQGSLVASIIQGALGLGFGLPLLIILGIFLYTIFWFPSIVAKRRGHAYTSLIQILNIAGLFTGVTWFIAAAWAIFPSEKSLIDPIVGNVTGLGRRNAGDTIGSAKHGSGRGAGFEADTDSQIDKLIDMHSKGLINDEEFARKKREIIQRNY
jgi:hypothetical protein